MGPKIVASGDGKDGGETSELLVLTIPGLRLSFQCARQRAKGSAGLRGRNMSCVDAAHMLRGAKRAHLHTWLLSVATCQQHLFGNSTKTLQRVLKPIASAGMNSANTHAWAAPSSDLRGPAETRRRTSTLVAPRPGVCLAGAAVPPPGSRGAGPPWPRDPAPSILGGGAPSPGPGFRAWAAGGGRRAVLAGGAAPERAMVGAGGWVPGGGQEPSGNGHSSDLPEATPPWPCANQMIKWFIRGEPPPPTLASLT